MTVRRRFLADSSGINLVRLLERSLLDAACQIAFGSLAVVLLHLCTGLPDGQAHSQSTCSRPVEQCLASVELAFGGAAGTPTPGRPGIPPDCGRM